MEFKKFLIPTRWKIIIFILLTIVTFIFAYFKFSGISCTWGCTPLEDGQIICPTCPLYSLYNVLPFSLGLIIPNYLIACFLVYIIRKIKTPNQNPYKLPKT